jgi:thiol-disulfide isomerase/thioredoxin
MKKIFYTAFFTIAIGLFTGLTAFAVPPKLNPLPSDYENGFTYEAAMRDTKPAVVYFYVNWCHYCRQFSPKFNAVSKIYGNKYNFVMIEADNYANGRVVSQFDIKGYPAVYVVNPKNKKQTPVDNSYMAGVKEFMEFLNKYGN